MDKKSAAHNKLSRREELFNNYGIPISERPNDSLLKREWMASIDFLETGKVAKGFKPQMVNLAYYVGEDEALKTELTEMLASKAVEAVKPDTVAPRCFAEVLDRMAVMDFAGWPKDISKDIMGDPSYTVGDIINCTVSKLNKDNLGPLVILDALTNVDPGSLTNPWVEEFLEESALMLVDDPEVGAGALAALSKSANAGKILAPIQELISIKRKEALAVALIVSGRTEVMEKLYSEEQMSGLVDQECPFAGALNDKPSTTKITVANALVDLQAKYGRELQIEP